ncbi:MAG: hypothetical protein ACRCX2_10270 [Paraclostridium sp.]
MEKVILNRFETREDVPTDYTVTLETPYIQLKTNSYILLVKADNKTGIEISGLSRDEILNLQSLLNDTIRDNEEKFV